MFQDEEKSQSYVTAVVGAVTNGDTKNLNRDYRSAGKMMFRDQGSHDLPAGSL